MPNQTTTESLATERGLVAAMLSDPSIIDEVSASIDHEMLSHKDMRQAFYGVVTMHAAGVRLSDLNGVGAHLLALGVSEDLCTIHSLVKLRNEGFPANRRWYLEEIRTAWKRRRLSELAEQAGKRADLPAADPDKIAAWLESQLDFLAAGAGGPLETRRAEAVADDVLAELQAAATTKPGVMTGVLKLDSTLGPIMPGELAIIAGRPGGGKTSLGMQIAQHVATRGPVLFISLEMKDRELIRRTLSSISGIDSRRLRESRIGPADHERLRDARTELTGLPLQICAPPRASIGQICGVAKYRKAVDGSLRMVFVDYIGLIQASGDDRRLERHLQVGQFTGALKALAKELECPVVALAQLNRDAQNKEPTLANLRESGSIEQDADIVLLIHHPSPGLAHLHIAKHRHGETGVVRMKWTPETTTFSAEDNAWTG
jgi:replicative DNA helicase